MVSSDFRAKAREKLSGKWGKAALIALCFFVYSLVLSYIDNHTTGFLNLLITIATIVIDIPIAYGLTMVFMKLYNDEEVGYFDFFTLGFENFSRSWSVAWNVFLKVIVPFILVIISYILIIVGVAGGIINYTSTSLLSSSGSVGAFGSLSIIGVILLIGSGIWLAIESLYYNIAQYIAIDNPSMNGKEVVTESRRLMDQKRAKLFCLSLSFIGWAILACFTFGIGMLWLSPYMVFATIAFYKYTLGNNETVVEAPVEEANTTEKTEE